MLALLTRNNGAIESVERRCGMKAEVADLDELALPVTDLDHYELKEKLGGEAPLTAVWRAVHRPSEEDVAIKRVQLLEITRTLMECLDCEMSSLLVSAIRTSSDS